MRARPATSGNMPPRDRARSTRRSYADQVVVLPAVEVVLGPFRPPFQLASRERETRILPSLVQSFHEQRPQASRKDYDRPSGQFPRPAVAGQFHSAVTRSILLDSSQAFLGLRNLTNDADKFGSDALAGNGIAAVTVFVENPL